MWKCRTPLCDVMSPSDQFCSRRRNINMTQSRWKFKRLDVKKFRNKAGFLCSRFFSPAWVDLHGCPSFDWVSKVFMFAHENITPPTEAWGHVGWSTLIETRVLMHFTGLLRVSAKLKGFDCSYSNGAQSERHKISSVSSEIGADNYNLSEVSFNS